MNILIVDSSKKRAFVDVVTDDKSFGYTLDENEKHSENLLKRIEEAINRADLDIEDIDVFSAVVGPGSFTGIRVGLSTIKAFNFVFNKKLVAVNSFEPFLAIAKNGIILLNSTHTTFYYARVKNSKIEDMGTVSTEELLSFIKNQKVYMLDYERYEELKDYDVCYVENYNELLKNVVCAKCKKQEFTLDVEFEPLYVQLSQAEEQLKNKNN